MKTRIATLLALVISLNAFIIAAPVYAQPIPVPVNGKYIVVFKDAETNPDGVSGELSRRHGFGLDQTYSRTLKGFAATIPGAKLNAVKADPRVKFVSEDRAVQASAVQSTPTGVRRINAPANLANKGTGVGVAVIDTGIDLAHPDLKPNIVASKSCVSNWWGFGAVSPNDDNGHGSHVAGTIAAVNNTQGVVGVAPEAKLIAVKVLNSQGSGTWSQIICGIEWVTANSAKYNIKVANLSLGGSGTSDNNCGNTNNDALHLAICKSVAAGVTYVVAAGNDGADATSTVPAAYNDAVITVSALADSNGTSGGGGAATSYGADDTFAGFSNYGAPVDITAPGVAIYSTWKSGGYNTISGTSMATPHVSGASALYIHSHPGSTWQQIRDGLRSAGEALGSGHTDPSGKHSEPVVITSSL